MTTSCWTFQFAGVNVSVSAESMPSVGSRPVTVMTTSAVGTRFSETPSVAVSPASLVTSASAPSRLIAAMEPPSVV
jgi:hypothetical protein